MFIEEKFHNSTWNPYKMGRDTCSTSLNGHFRCRGVRYEGVWLHLCRHRALWLNEWAQLAPTVQAPQSNYRIWAVHLIRMPGGFPHWRLHIYDGTKKEGRITPVFKLMEIEVTSFDCIWECQTHRMYFTAFISSWHVERLFCCFSCS